MDKELNEYIAKMKAMIEYFDRKILKINKPLKIFVRQWYIRFYVKINPIYITLFTPM